MSMTAAQFAERISDVAKNYETSYIGGVFGAPITEATVQRAERAYQKNITNGYAAAAQKLIGNPKAFYFDCVGLIKAIL